MHRFSFTPWYWKGLMSVVGHSSFTARNIYIFRLWLSRFIQLHFSQILCRWKKGSSNNRESDFNILMIWLTIFYYTCNMINYVLLYLWYGLLCLTLKRLWRMNGVKISSHCLRRWSVLFNWRSYRRGPNYHSKRAGREESVLSYVELSPHIIRQRDGHLCCFTKSWGQSYCFCRPSSPPPPYPTNRHILPFLKKPGTLYNISNSKRGLWLWR